MEEHPLLSSTPLPERLDIGMRAVLCYIVDCDSSWMPAAGSIVCTTLLQRCCELMAVLNAHV